MVVEMSDIGKLLIVSGVVLAALGALMLFVGRVPFLGRLPGDIVWRKGNTVVYVPIMTGILFSLLLSLILWIWRR
jgi:hypothetical protein